MMRELRDGSSLVGDAVGLQRALAEDGYVFVRELVVDEAAEAANAILEIFREVSWVDRDGRLSAGYSAATAQPDPAYRRAAASAAFNRLPYLDALGELVSYLIGECWPLPSKVLRATPPARLKTEPGRFTHQDFSYWGVNDMITTWVALMDIDLAHGGLALRPGSQRGPQVPLDLLDPRDADWASADYRCGDVVAFHCLTSHAARPNTRDVLRLSGDFRWVSVHEPVAVELVRGSRGSSRELLEAKLGGEPWWRPVPTDAVLVDGRPAPPGRSRFFDVDGNWQSWSEPVGGLDASDAPVQSS
ncbi:MAG: phytanoyl-CoA dioxygenase family protein [Actinomycetota bacterium]